MLPQTGERFHPTETGQNKYEHLHRYAVCNRLVKGKDVLDVASGEGYGVSMMSASARSVVGVDISREAVEHSRRVYYHENVRFLVGDCAAIPIADASVDVVTSFETLEHHHEHDEMFAEIKRVLRPGGLLVMSSPNKLVYSDEAGFTNQFHVRELYYDEFSALCRRNFPFVQMYGQLLGVASFLLPLSGRVNALTAFGQAGDETGRGLAPPKLPMYFVAVCSQSDLPRQMLDSLYFDIDEDFFGQLTRPQRASAVRRIHPPQAQAALGASRSVAALGPGSSSNEPSELRRTLEETMRALETATQHGAQLAEELATLRTAYATHGQPGALEADSVKAPTSQPSPELGSSPAMDVGVESQLLKAEQRIQIAEAELRRRDELVATLKRQLENEKIATTRAVATSVERNRRLTSIDGALLSASRGADHWRSLAAILASELADSVEALTLVRGELNAVMNSRSWRATTFLRQAKASIVGSSAAG